MTRSLWPLTPVLLMHLSVEHVQLWTNSSNREGPGPGVRNDFVTPDVRARGYREGGDGCTERGWRKITGNETYQTNG